MWLHEPGTGGFGVRPHGVCIAAAGGGEAGAGAITGGGISGTGGRDILVAPVALVTGGGAGAGGIMWPYSECGPVGAELEASLSPVAGVVGGGGGGGDALR
jgi:hypothetical protein